LHDNQPVDTQHLQTSITTIMDTTIAPSYYPGEQGLEVRTPVRDPASSLHTPHDGLFAWSSC